MLNLSAFICWGGLIYTNLKCFFQVCCAPSLGFWWWYLTSWYQRRWKRLSVSALTIMKMRMPPLGRATWIQFSLMEWQFRHWHQKPRWYGSDAERFILTFHTSSDHQSNILLLVNGLAIHFQAAAGHYSLFFYEFVGKPDFDIHLLLHNAYFLQLGDICKVWPMQY